MRIVGLATLLVLTSAASLQAQRILLTLPAARDATLYEDATGQSANDAGQAVFLGDNSFGEARRTLIAFDFSAVPRGARIVSAELQLTIAQSAAGATGPLPVTVHRVLSPWTEGPTAAPGAGGNGAQAQAGDTTWTMADYPGTAWNTPGGDYVAAPSGSFQMPTGGLFSMDHAPGMIGDVQYWVANLLPNHGWILRTPELGVQDARRLHSRESTLIGVQPTLTIGYVLPGTSWARGAGCVGSNGQNLVQTLIGSPTLGTVATLRVQGGVQFQPIHLLLAGSLNTLSPPVLTGCHYELDLLSPVFFPARMLDANGATDYVFPIPPDPNLFGISLSFQSLVLDPFLAPYFLTLSNGVMVVLG